MLHAVTAAVTYDFYENPGKLSEVQTAAMANLESLMDQFMGMDFSNEDTNAYVAASVVALEIQNGLSQGDNIGKAVALQEFIAWSLTNQALADSLRTSKVRTPLMKLPHKALAGLHKLLGLPGNTSLDMFANIAWNTAAVIRTTPKNRMSAKQRLAQTPASLVLNQISPNNDNRLQTMMQRFEAKIAVHLRGMEPKGRVIEEIDIKDVAHKALNMATSSGFDLDIQQASAFRSMQAALASSMDLDKGALLKAQEIFTAVTKTLSPEALMQNFFT